MEEENNNAYMEPDSVVTKSDIEAVCRHDHDAFRKVYLHSIGPLVGFLQMLLRSRDNAEDMAQSVFTYIWENVDKLDASKNFNSYLYVIAKSMAFKQMARKKLYDKYCDYKLNTASLLDTPTDDIVIDREISLLINIYIGNMPTQRKRVFEMHRTGKTDSEIAEAMNISINTVRTHMKLAKKGLRELVAGFVAMFALFNVSSI